jgi:hypothetical protein
MLNFNDFTEPLSEGRNIGESFREWFDAQAPYQLWEQEWFYGMVVFGDPTLCIQTPIQMKVTRPENALYIGDKEIIPLTTPVSIGKITIEVSVQNINHEIEKVDFYVDDTLKSSDEDAPYSWAWSTLSLFRHEIKVIAYDTAGQSAIRQFTIWKFL